jgi:CRP-like cAMP-binding protein
MSIGYKARNQCAPQAPERIDYACPRDKRRTSNSARCPLERDCPLFCRPRRTGEFLFFEGEPARTVWFLRRGTVVLSRGWRSNGEDNARAVRSAGAFLGLEALVRSSYLDTARAVTGLIACNGSRDAVDQWLGPADTPTRAALDQVLLSVAAERPRAASSDGTSLHRVARWLLDESFAGVAQPLPRRLIAQLLGMVPETLSRALSELASLGAIEVTRRSLEIRNVAALKAAAKPRSDV